MTGRAFDAIIIGAGHNGLVAANYMAKAGQRVLVLEAASRIGGAATSKEIAPGYLVPAMAHLVEGLPYSIERELKLAKFGLRYPKQKMGTVALNLDGHHLFLDAKKDEIGPRLGDADRAALAEFRREIAAYARILAPMLKEAPDASKEGVHKMFTRLYWRMAISRQASLAGLLQLMPQCIGDRLDATFDSAELKGALAADALIGGSEGPYEPGTWFRLVYREALRSLGRGLSLPLGGVPALLQALGGAATANGVEIHLETKVSQILTRSEIVTGVETESGSIFSAPVVISSLDPLTSVSDFLDAAQFEAQTLMRLKRNISRGMSAKINFALDHLPVFRGLAEHELGQRILIAPALDELDRAYVQAKRGEEPVDALYEIVIPTMHADATAPAGGHVMSIVKHYVPYESNEDARALAHTVNMLERFAPGISSSIVAAEYLSPRRIEDRFSLRGGGWYQGNLRPDQLLQMRPAPGFSQSATSVMGLYLCGTGFHPGGGISGLSGKFAADAALARQRK